MQRTKVIEYNAYNILYRILCIGYNGQNALHRIQCIHYITFALNTEDRTQYNFLVHRTQYIANNAKNAMNKTRFIVYTALNKIPRIPKQITMQRI